MPQAPISLTLSRHFSLSLIASGRSSGPHPVSSHSCWMYVRAGRPAFAWPYVGVHRSTSLMSSSLLLQQWPACLVRLTWIVFMMGGRWPSSGYYLTHSWDDKGVHTFPNSICPKVNVIARLGVRTCLLALRSLEGFAWGRGSLKPNSFCLNIYQTLLWWVGCESRSVC